MTSLATNNTAWGFWGTIAHHADPAAAWPLAIAQVSEATGLREAAVRIFLDTRYGRYFADEVTEHLTAGQDIETAIGTAIDIWMSWIINPYMARVAGFPEGMPYLTALIGKIQVGAALDTGPRSPEVHDATPGCASSQVRVS